MVDITPADQDFAAQALAKLNPSVTMPNPIGPLVGDRGVPIIQGPGPIITDNNIPPSIVAPPSAPVVPFNVTAPEHLNPGMPASPTPVKPIGGPIVQSAPNVNLSPADATSGPQGKDTRESEIVNKYTDKIGALQTQLDNETNPNRAAALKLQIKSLTDAQNNALKTNDAAYGMYVQDANGNYHLDASKLGTINPRQKAGFELQNKTLEEDNLAKAQKLEQTGVDAQTQAQIAHNDAVSASLSNLASQQKADQMAREQRQQQFQQQLEEKRKSIDSDISTFSSAKLNPNQYWQDQGTAGVVGQTLLAGLVGGLNAANGIQGNQVLSRIDKSIDNDIDAQKFNIQKQGKAIDFANNALATFERQGYDREQAIAMSKAAGYDAANNELKAKLATLDNKSALAAGQVLSAQLQQRAAQTREAALTPYVNADIAAHTAVPGAGANKGYITSMVGGKLLVKNVATGQVSEANDDQKAKYFATEKTRVETAKTQGQVGAPGKQSAKIKTAVDQSSGIPEALAPVLESYSGVGTNVFGTTAKTDANLNNLATKIGKATGRNPEEIVNSWKKAFSNGTARDIITHDAQTAEEVRQHLATQGGAVEDEKTDDSGNGE